MTKKELKELLDSLTIKEKIGQMFQALPHIFGEDGAITGIFDENVETDDIIATVGSILNMYDTERMKKLQEEHLKS
ncbi:MAG: beta-glucosidase, partial [Clostridia bacterium]|nr:beta-glucosidase [Clostridia bacterium]